jgi:hypothetical protein
VAILVPPGPHPKAFANFRQDVDPLYFSIALECKLAVDAIFIFKTFAILFLPN